jgi:hypothetical protein
MTSIRPFSCSGQVSGLGKNVRNPAPGGNAFGMFIRSVLIPLTMNRKHWTPDRRQDRVQVPGRKFGRERRIDPCVHHPLGLGTMVFFQLCQIGRIMETAPCSANPFNSLVLDKGLGSDRHERLALCLKSSCRFDRHASADAMSAGDKFFNPKLLEQPRDQMPRFHGNEIILQAPRMREADAADTKRFTTLYPLNARPIRSPNRRFILGLS